ncbi:MAG: LPS assembly lipoprotein LptE [Gemmatimonadota bacterium]|nr:LPS assembly lipoprotein LptE [Gemmatimonadota bacterium]
MSSRPSRRRGVRASGVLASLIGAFLLSGCYSFSGGGGLPSHIRTAYVRPVDNLSTKFGLAESLADELLTAARQRLGLRLAAEEEADAIITATIQRYSDAAVNFEAVEGQGADVFQRRVTITAQVEILDRRENAILWQSAGLSGTGEYVPGSETEDQGSLVAIENLVQKVVDGAQSQW